MFGLHHATAPADQDRLIAQCRHGNRQAFDALVDLHRASVYGYFLARVLNLEDAQDLAQETFLQAYRHLNTFQGRSAFSTWLLALAKRVYVDYLRQRDPPHVSLDELDEPPQEEPDWEAVDRRMTVRAALGAVPEQYREVIVLKDIEGLTYEEIAADLNLPQTTVAYRLREGRLWLGRELIRRDIRG
jgi:RNA polymerase sigma-70 factor (ECF subfamily)